MKELGILGWIAWVFLIIGGIDSGIYGLFSFHLLEVILGTKFNGRFAYILIGLSAIYLIYHTIKQRKAPLI
jgi:uncharacterized membrane protein YuzA (DUF378 family)